ncbi:PucR family transcriptional regulator ligand-binding domain-containing protein [Pseudomonas chengduensis]|nr:PucR family transcriptional regulator [Pseudomonas chengduensis]MDH0622864.1 PucR family transcriptional regulator ligand-binding domain-containing protein [Pseudomonas chengduensis]MDH1211327.1 PucR family transcriptional regulator ligand-binding domain-containing protein [Pseudomonas chengduensis]MDH1279946.1 PucR family transcriptional regulator ligand-binding domain-containing protein [Pseudomonas chengduensis]MDH1664756.1 PucR family transcriptional regulator ligand-binding domain-conta
MSLTVVDVLALPGLASMRLRAGQAGRDNAVRWPYVAENEGIADWVMGGELIFVTGINHPRDEANLLRLVREGHERVVAGLVILTGAEFIQVIPPSVIEEAERLNLPLIEQPYALKMVVVTQAIGTALVQAQQLGRSRQHVLEQVLDGDYQSLEVLLQRGDSLGLALHVPRQVALLRLDGSEQLFGDLPDEDAERQLQSRQQLLQRRLEQSLGELGDALPLVSQGRHWIALLPCPDTHAETRNRQAMTALLDELRPQLGPLRLFLGLGSTGCDAQRFAQGLGEARQALAVAQRFPERLGLCSFNELGVLELLGAIRDRSLLDRFVERVLGALIGDDSRHQPVLMPTLEAWFAENGNLALAAQRLNVHRNTLSYRLQRIEALTGCSFEDPHDRLNISVALLIRRLSSPA